MLTLHRWTTTDEVQFLRGIGTYRTDAVKPAPPAVRLSALEGYKTYLSLRSDWGEMDQARIAEVVEELLDAARTQIAREAALAANEAAAAPLPGVRAPGVALRVPRGSAQ